jgi:hypothetical protein
MSVGRTTSHTVADFLDEENYNDFFAADGWIIFPAGKNCCRTIMLNPPPLAEEVSGIHLLL